MVYVLTMERITSYMIFEVMKLERKGDKICKIYLVPLEGAKLIKGHIYCCYYTIFGRGNGSSILKWSKT